MSENEEGVFYFPFGRLEQREKSGTFCYPGFVFDFSFKLAVNELFALKVQYVVLGRHFHQRDHFFYA